MADLTTSTDNELDTYTIAGDMDDTTVHTNPQNLMVLAFVAQASGNKNLNALLQSSCDYVSQMRITNVHSIFLLVKECLKIAEVGGDNMIKVLDIINFQFVNGYLNSNGTNSLLNLSGALSPLVSRSEILEIVNYFSILKVAYLENSRKEDKQPRHIILEQEDAGVTARIFHQIQTYIVEAEGKAILGISNYIKFHVRNKQDLIAAYFPMQVFLNDKLVMPEIPGQFILMLKEIPVNVNKFLKDPAEIYYGGEKDEFESFIAQLINVVSIEG